MPKNDIDNITLPVYKRLKNETKKEIADAIEADKDVLGQITFSQFEEDEISYDRWDFPAHIIPIHILFDFNGTTVRGYPDFENETLIVDNETLSGEIYISCDNEYVFMTAMSSYDLEIIGLEYILQSPDVVRIPFYQNWYKILNPAPNVEEAQSGTIASGGVLGLNSEGKVVKGSISGGTQLYKHFIQLTAYPTGKSYKFNDDGTITVNTLSPSYASKTISIISDVSSSVTSFIGFAFRLIIGVSASFGTDSYRGDVDPNGRFTFTNGSAVGYFTLGAITSDTVTPL